MTTRVYAPGLVAAGKPERGQEDIPDYIHPENLVCSLEVVVAEVIMMLIWVEQSGGDSRSNWSVVLLLML